MIVHELHGRECQIIIEARPAYCDRGNFIAKIFPRGDLARDLDHQDGWPRYYFDLERAIAECTAWLLKRGQALDPPNPEPRKTRRTRAEVIAAARAMDPSRMPGPDGTHIAHDSICRDLYDAARMACHEVGLPWTDPRTHITYDPPPKEKP